MGRAAPTMEDLKNAFHGYVNSKGNNLLALDHDEFLAVLEKPMTNVTSVQRVYARRLLDAHIEAELQKQALVEKKSGENVSVLPESTTSPTAALTIDDMKTALQSYVSSKWPDWLALDHDEFLAILEKPGIALTS